MEFFKTTIGELFDFYVEHEEETFICGTVLHMFDPKLQRVNCYGGTLFDINVIEVFHTHFPAHVTGPFVPYGGKTFEWYIDSKYYKDGGSTREVRIRLLSDILTTYGPDFELEFKIVKLVN